MKYAREERSTGVRYAGSTRYRPGRRIAVSFSLAFGLVSGRALATPAELFGAGPESVALAGAGSSLALGAESAISNPARLAPATKLLVGGLRVSRFALELGEAGNPTAFSVEMARGLYLGAVTPLSDGEVETAFGLFAGSAPDHIVRAHLPFAEVADFPLLVGRASAFDFAAALGVRYDIWSFGAGVRALAALSGRVGAVERGERVVQVVDNDLVPAYAPAFGLGVDPGAGIAVGVVFRSALRADFDVNLATGDLGGVPLAPMHIQGVAHYEPLRLDAEVSKRFAATTLLVALAYERWSDYPGPLGATVECASDVSDCRARAPAPPRANDVVVPRLGVAHELGVGALRATLRGGYAFTPAALPEQRELANDFDSARHTLAAGYSLALPPEPLPLALEAALRFDLLVPREHEKPDGTSLEASGHVTTFLFGARLGL